MHAMGAPVLVRLRALLNHYFHSCAHPCAGSTCICACWAVWTCQCCHEESQLVGAELPVVSVCLGWSIEWRLVSLLIPTFVELSRLSM